MSSPYSAAASEGSGSGTGVGGGRMRRKYGTVHYTHPETGKVKTGVICQDGIRIEVPGEGIFSGVLEWLKESRLHDPPENCAKDTEDARGEASSPSIESAMNSAMENLEKAFDSEAPPPRRQRRSRSVQQPPPGIKIQPVLLDDVDTWASHSQRPALLTSFLPSGTVDGASQRKT